MRRFQVAMPKSVPGAVAASGDDFDETKFLAGGTDLLAEIKDHTQFPDVLVNLKSIPGLKEIKVSDSGVEIGALVTLSELASHKEIKRSWPALVEAIGHAASPQIRNVGTVGGNLCQRVRCWYYRHDEYPCLKKGGQICYAQQGENEYHSVFGNRICAAPHPSSTAPVLIAYGAQVEIHGPEGARTIDLEDFFHSPEDDVTQENILTSKEVVTKITLDRANTSKHSAYCEARERDAFDWSLCGATVNLQMDGDSVKRARVVLSAIAPTPVRRKDLEKVLVESGVGSGALEKIAKLSIRGARPLEQNEYKLTLVKAMLKRAILKAVKG